MVYVCVCDGACGDKDNIGSIKDRFKQHIHILLAWCDRLVVNFCPMPFLVMVVVVVVVGAVML